MSLLTQTEHALARENGRRREVGWAGESFQKCNEVRFIGSTQAKWIDFGCSTWTINSASIVKFYYRRKRWHRSVVHVGTPARDVTQSWSFKRIAQCC